MRTFLLCCCLFFNLTAFAQDAAVKQTIEHFFEGFHQRDTLKMKAVCDSSLRLQSITTTQTKGTQLSEEQASRFFQSIANVPSTLVIEERILSYSIQIDGAMAVAWTPYQFYVNNKLSHEGVNVFTLFQEQGTWKIISIIDTRRRS
ncbi:Putative lumazine-binding [Flavobacterium fontis]|uniref:Putative lumazine-binding n=1 Tax=Flavobacterium fontis TaxID=1124188 RepID=A0A1M5D6J7_9FLAO|nr:nuclear transport factor 2 family protein [Flavobacterium fontis]SHF62616.1 Putative lumazine-binding [Flavobacterium fontis]